MKLSISLITAAFCLSTVLGEPIDRIIARQDSVTAATKTSCPTKKARKTLEWDYSLPPWPFQKPRYFQSRTLETPGSGWVWRDSSADTTDYISRPILFENGQGWEVVNCTWKYAASDPVLKGCNGYGILNTPGTNIGDAPPDKGKIGTLSSLPLGGVSPWSIYDLVSFKLTPIVDSKFNKEQITIEVFGWHDDGSKTGTVRFKIKGSDVGYLVSLPKGGWDKILQWQVRVWWSAGSRETRQDFPFLIDTVVTDEYDVPTTTTDTRCEYITESPLSTPTAAVTLKFDDIAASPTGTIPVPYHSYTFSSNWVVTNAKSYPKNHPGYKSATSGSNALYSPGIANGQDLMISGEKFLFDTQTLHITIDSTNVTSPADIEFTIKSYGSCLDGGAGYSETLPGQYIQIYPTSYSFDVATTSFIKMRAISIFVIDTVSLKLVPFWVDDIVVKSWKDGLKGVSGCERCSIPNPRVEPLSSFCEYPKQSR